MPSFGKASKERLSSANKDLQVLFEEVVKIFDCTVIYGHRSPNLQKELFMKGRKELADGSIVIVDKKRVVTYKDGTHKRSKHNAYPSLAVDVAPYPVDWDDTDRMYYFAGHVNAIAIRLYEEGKMENKMRWGGDWDSDTEVDDQTFMDLVHFELI